MISATNTPNFSPDYLQAARDVQYQLVAAFTFLAWDLILSLPEEIEYVWGMRRCISKWLFFYFRYYMLATHIFHLIISPYLSSGRTPDSLCIIWYRYITFLSQFSFCMTEIILVIRVHALFNRSRRVAVFFGVLILSQLAIAIFWMVKGREAHYFEACILPYPPKRLLHSLGGVNMTIQSITIGMTVFKQVAGMRLGWGRTPLLSFLVKDATGNYIAGVLLCGLGLAACGIDDIRTVAILHWTISLYSTIGCRLILNMEHFARGNVLDDEIVLTTQITL